jgi:ubiquinone/menaquinone biosynthesis C-methylase UbiE
MLDKLYYRFRKLITKESEQNQASGGLWPRLTREAAASLYSNVSGKLIELGCGEGLFIELIAAANPNAEVYGIDFRESVIETAKNRLLGRFPNVKLLTGNALTTQLENMLFDITYCMNTVYNLRSADEVKSLFKEAFRITKPGGKFIFDIRNSLSPVILLQYALVRYYDPGITVSLRHYTKSFIIQMVKECGFTVTDCKYIGFPNNAFSPAILFVAERA